MNEEEFRAAWNKKKGENVMHKICLDGAELWGTQYEFDYWSKEGTRVFLFSNGSWHSIVYLSKITEVA